MSWLQEFEEDIIAREQVYDELEAELINSEEVREILAPLLDGSLDPGDLETVTNTWWNKYGLKEIEAAKKEVEIHRRLAKLYTRLECASPEEWELYARTVLNARINKKLLQMIVERGGGARNEE